MNLQFTYLEINPLVVTTKSIYILDLASRLDQTADYLCASKWGKIEFPPPFGRDAYAEVKKTKILFIINSKKFLFRKHTSLNSMLNPVHH
jgi:succinyl-CoA synthetase beta subunit